MLLFLIAHDTNASFSIQLVFSNFYLGIAQGALDYAAQYTKKNTRAWPFGGDVSGKEPSRFSQY